ncbi:MAG: hypothetical protein A3F09_01930 [Chlamydiae bacterium RIFCSPHIGHO2_12_FULL_49_11]|nr:MAG: hypothetical protein A3F09_01930 [Chlamydiae bacterium RIFCSPHIGHO2_12_FULL_49_11]
MTQEKTRLCPSCEGRVENKARACPYCGISLYKKVEPETDDQLRFKFAPPYQTEMGKQLFESSKKLFQSDTPVIPVAPKKPRTPFFHSDFVTKVVPTFLLSLGSQLFVLAFAIFFFSAKNSFVLEWNAHSWWKFLLCSAVLSFLGYRFLGRRKIKDPA